MKKITKVLIVFIVAFLTLTPKNEKNADNESVISMDWGVTKVYGGKD